MGAAEERKALDRLPQAVRNLITGARAGAKLDELPPAEMPALGPPETTQEEPPA